MSTCVVKIIPRWFTAITHNVPKLGNINRDDRNINNSGGNIDTVLDNNSNLSLEYINNYSNIDGCDITNSNIYETNNNINMVATKDIDIIQDTRRYCEVTDFREKTQPSNVVRTARGYRYRTIQDPASQRLTWYKPPLTVLVIKKVRDASVLNPFVQLVQWLIEEKRMVVFVEASVMDDKHLDQISTFSVIKDKLMTFKEGNDDLTDKIDFIICLGGDGTLLYASHLFQQSVPPVMAFHLGSLGFLTPFQFDNFQEQVTNVLEGHAALTLRSRLRCIVIKKGDCKKLKHSDDKPRKPPTNLLVLNEVVIDRGPSPYLSNIDLFLDGKHITSVQGDGLIVSTPTGSTAYAVAAGASMIHPSVPAIMVTPICPHSLSFRPIVVPAGVELKISISPDSRNSSWVSFDGRNRLELLHGDSLRVTTSIYPVPSISAQDQISDWFDSLAECLHWNVRKRQRHLDELSDLTHSSSDDTLDSLEVENVVELEKEG